MAEPKDTEKTKADDKASKPETAAKKPATKKPATKKPAAEKAKTAAKPKAETKAKTAAKKTEPKKTEPKTKTTAKAAAKAPAKPKTTAKPKPKPKEEKGAPTPLVVRASARYVRVAPRKARHLADQIRGLPIEDARSLLRFSPRGAAQDVSKLLDSAAANAENNYELIADDLMITEIHVDEGPTLKRYRPRALGRATPINKRTSHISLALTPEEDG
jgi:ribosomal protein L22